VYVVFTLCLLIVEQSDVSIRNYLKELVLRRNKLVHGSLDAEDGFLRFSLGKLSLKSP
jgi:hypothetical protein